MFTTDQIKALTKSEKSKIWNYFFGQPPEYRKSLSSIQKHELNALLLFCIEKPINLCIFLRKPFSELERILNHPEYRQYSIRKKKGGSRDISAPDNELKKIQKRLNYFLQAYYLCIKPDEVHGFVVNPHYTGSRCNIVENAKIHTGKKHILNIDLKDFFSSITAQQVKSIFTSDFFGYNEQIATALTLLTTFEGKLPTGAPTSPVLSNFVCHQLDKELKAFSKTKQLSYSRYADDLTFSSETLISQNEVQGIIDVIQENHFTINEKKLRLKTSNRKQSVTGITVNEKVNVNRKLLKKTRAMLHDLIKNGAEAATRRHFNISGDLTVEIRRKFIFRLEGYINFIGQVRGKNDRMYLSMKNGFDRKFQAN